MFKKRFITILIVISLLALVPAIAIAKGPGGGGGGGGPGGGTGGGGEGGGHTEVAGNNLSVPVIWSEGQALISPITDAMLTDPYLFDTIDVCDGGFLYAQKTDGNVWQAENINGIGTTYVDEIDWGDSLESVDMKVNRPVRVELSLFKILPEGVNMTGFDMYMLANPSSPEEIQGVCAISEYPDVDNISTIVTKEYGEATVYTPYAALIIQKFIVENPTLEWNGIKWVSSFPDQIEEPFAPTFSGELNVGGKVIYGLSTGGWRPTDPGVYRITFFMPTLGNTLFWEDENGGGTVIRISSEEESVAVAEEEGDIGGGVAQIDVEKNLTYIDVTVVGGGGGGGGGKGRP